MVLEFKEKSDGGIFRLHQHEPKLKVNYYDQLPGYTFHTIAWNTGEDQEVVIDELRYLFRKDTVLPIMLNQTFRFERPEQIVAVQFNREFYCIVNHDAEVGCVGYLFFGPNPVMFITLEENNLEKMKQLFALLSEEFTNQEEIKGSMLRMLLVQFIITLTRLSKKQYIGQEPAEDQFNLLRQFNLLVEIHFRKEKQVQFYATKLFKSPKTISNIFAKYSKKSPLTIIHQRVVTEAKRLIYYTDKSIKEIATELGFEDVSHFSKFIKGQTQKTPTELKKERVEI